MDAKELLRRAEGEAGWMEEHLRALVLRESPTEDAGGVNAAGELVSGWCAELGGRVRVLKQKGFGDVLRVRFGPRTSGRKPVLLLGHLDTVWAAGTIEAMPWRVGEGRYWGPGVLDMKAGVVMALTAIKLLKGDGLPVVEMLLNSEEEVGSPVSRAITEEVARGSAAVFVLEPAQGLAYKTARKGVGHYEIQVKGVAAHSGVDFERGHSAVLELAKLVQTVSGFTDLGKKRTVNCGVLRGGTRANVVAGEAQAEVDVRIAKASDAREVERMFRGLKVSDPACRLTVRGGINRPPMERKAGTIALFKRARGLAKEMGFELAEAATGGGSDGNFTAALGVPTLDGMGAVGEGAHAANESVVIEHLAPRTALLAAMIASVGAAGG